MKRKNIARERKQFARQFEDMLSGKDNVFFDTYAYERIMEYYESQVNFAKAMKAANFALEQHPYSAFFLLKKGEYLLEMKKPSEALSYLEKALIFDPADLRVYFITSDAYLELGNFEKALDILHEAATMSDKHELPDVYLEIADVYEEMEKPQMVLKYLKKSLWKAPRHIEAQGRFQFTTEINNWDKDAVTFLTKLSDKDPYAKNIWLNLGNAYSNLEQFENAAEAYELAVAIDENYDVAYEELGAVYYKMKEYKRAIENLSEAVKRNKIIGLESAYFLLGKCYSDLQDYNQATYYFNKALNLDKTYFEAYFELACCYVELGNFPLALQNINKALEENASDFDYHLTAANILFCLEDMDKALSQIEMAIKTNPQSAEDWVMLTLILFGYNEVELAIELLNHANITRGNEALKYYHLCAYYFELGKKQQALSNLTEALSLDSDAYTELFELNAALQEIPEVLDLIQLYQS